jgi:hypothetical protein
MTSLVTSSPFPVLSDLRMFDSTSRSCYSFGSRKPRLGTISYLGQLALYSLSFKCAIGSAIVISLSLISFHFHL